VHLGSSPISVTLDEDPTAPLVSAIRYHDRAYLGPAGLSLDARLDGRIISASQASWRHITVDETGPVRSVVRIEGDLASPDGTVGLGLLALIHVYRGLPVVHLRLRIFGPTRGGRVADLSVRLLPRVTTGALGAAPPGRRLVGLEKEGALTSLSSPENPDDGWLLHQAAGLRAVLVDPRFGACPPRRVTVSRDAGLELRLLEGEASWPAGGVLTADVVLRLGDDVSKTTTQASPEGVGAPVQFLADPEWLFATGLFPRLARPDGRLSRLLDHAARFLDEEGRSLRGWRDTGDWRMPDGTPGNLEFDTLRGTVLAYLCTRDLAWAERARWALRHHLDIDFHRNPAWSFVTPRPELLAHSHGPDHRGGRVELGHVWLEGPVEAALLLGNDDDVADVTAMGWTLLQEISTGFPFSRERDLAWTLIGLSALERHLGPVPFRAALRDLAVRCAERRGRSGVLPFGLLEGDRGPTHQVSSWVGGGLLVEGFGAAHEATGDERFFDLGVSLARLVGRHAPLPVDAANPEEGPQLSNTLVVDADGTLVARRGRVVPENLIVLGAGLKALSGPGGGAAGATSDRALEIGLARLLSLWDRERPEGPAACKLLRSLDRLLGADPRKVRSGPSRRPPSRLRSGPGRPKSLKGKLLGRRATRERRSG
jgi:hypothetical protein